MQSACFHHVSCKSCRLPRHELMVNAFDEMHLKKDCPELSHDLIALLLN